MLAFATNFIPNIGFFIALIPPVVIAVATDGWLTALAIVAAYSVANFSVQTFIQPRFVSHAVKLSLTLTFLSVVFWAAVVGPIGAILAVPLTLIFRVLLLEQGSGSRLARWISGDRVGRTARSG